MPESEPIRLQLDEMFSELDAFKFAIGPWKSRYSPVWRIWGTEKNDVYLGVSSMLQSIKVSLHSSRWCRIAYTNEQNERLIASGAKQEGSDRLIYKWKRNYPAEREITHVLNIHFPLACLGQTKMPEGRKKRPICLLEPDVPSLKNRNAITAKIMFHRLHPEDQQLRRFVNGQGLMPFVYVELPNGEFASVLYEYNMIDPKKLKDAFENAKAYPASSSSLDAMSPVGTNQTGLSMMYTEGGTPPSITNIGGLAIEKTGQNSLEISIEDRKYESSAGSKPD